MARAKALAATSLVALLLLLASSWAQEPTPPSEYARRSSGGSVQSQTGDSQGETDLVFPDYVDGGGWSVQLVLSNVDPEAAVEVRVDVYDPDGQPVLDLFDSDLTFEIPSLGSRVLRSGGSGAIRRGWIEVETDSDSVSGLLTYRHGESGIEVGVNPVELGPRFALFVEESPTVGAGVAVFKPDASPRLELRIRDEEGDDPLEGGFIPWRDFLQAARTLPEWFDVEEVDTGFLTDFRGLLFLETEDESPFAPLGIRFGKRTSSLSAVPAIRTHSEETQETDLVFPDYVDGGGWSVQLVLSNVDPDTAAEVRVEVHDSDGQPVLDLFDSDMTLEIPTLGSRVLRSAGAGAIRRGWIQVQTDSATVGGLLTYRDAQSGVEVGVDPVRLSREFALSVEESNDIGTGLAIFNPHPSSGIEFRIYDEDGANPLGERSARAGGFNQAARTIPEWFAMDGIDTEFLEDFRGLLFLRAEDGSLFAPLGLRFGKRTASLSSIPVIRVGEPPDLVVQTLSVNDSTPTAGESFTLSAAVHNQGKGHSASTTLRYFRSSDETISTNDTQVGTETVSALVPAGTSDESIGVTAPLTAGTYYYGACVDPVSGESATGNNCSGSRAVTVQSASSLQIYNDNVFVLPVTENLAALWTNTGSSPPLEDYTARLYEHFDDEFDFLIFFASLDYSDLGPRSIDGAFYNSVKNDVQGIGLSIFSHNRRHGSAGKLQGIVFHSYDDRSSFRGLLLHELMHRWGNFVVPITSFPGGPHWGFSSSGGYLDCYDISNMIDHGAGRFSAPNPFYFRSSEQFSPIELYLAGFIPSEDVPDFQIAENGKWLLDERGYIVEDDNGYRMFTASGFKTVTIEGIIADHGPRVPDHSQAQKDFRAAVILLVSEKYPATRKRLERLSDDVSWFSHAGRDESGPPVTNFYEATGGRGTITMDGLSQFQSRTRAKRLAPSSFGTPPPPIVDRRE